jgi:O-antigen ligase
VRALTLSRITTSGPRLRPRGHLDVLRIQHGTLVAGASGLSVVLGYVLVRHSVAMALGLLLILPAVWLITRRTVGLLAAVAMMLVLPYWQTLGTAQASVLRLASLAAVVTFLVSDQRIRLNGTDLAVLALVAVTVLGWLLQYDEPHAGRIVSIVLTPLGLYAGARALPQSLIPRVMSVTLFAGTLGALTVIYEYLVGHPVFLAPATYQWSTTESTIFRPGGIFGGPPGASTVLCFVILFGIAAFGHMKGRVRVLAAACWGICVLALILTFTRAAFIALAVGLIVFLWLIRSPLLRPARAVWFGGLLAVIVLLVLPTLESSSAFQKGVLRSGTLAAREGYWTVALPIVTASPHNLIFGVGTGSLETPTVYANAKVLSPLAVRPQVFTTSLHSQYMTNLVEQGLVGLAAVVFLLAVPFLRVAKAARSTTDWGYAALAASLIAVAVVMSVDTALFHGPSFAMIMVSAGLAATATASVRLTRGPHGG